MDAAVRDADALLRDGEPDWARVDFELECSRCGYNLRLLTQPRCPECGFQFDWREVLDATLARSDFLFEHHWRQRPIRSYVVTVWRAMRPGRFWQRVSMHERVYPRPLMFMLLSSVLAFGASFHTVAALGAWACAALRWADAKTSVRLVDYRIITTERMLKQLAVAPTLDEPTYFVLPAGVLVAALAATACVCSLRQTLGRCRVRTVQVLRVAAYMATPAAIVVAPFVVAFLTVSMAFRGVPGQLWEEHWPLIALVILVAIPGAYFAVGLKRYLKLPRAVLLGFTASFMAVLFTAAVFVVVQQILR